MESINSTTNSDTLELVLKNSFLKTTLSIDRLGITYGKKHVFFSDIESLRYGATAVSVNAIPTSVNYTFNFLDTQNKKFTILFSAVALSKNSKQGAEQHNRAIIDILWKHLTSKIVNKMINTLNSKGTVKVGNFEIRSNGINITHRRFIFSKREALIPWKECLKGVGPGYFYIQSATDKKVIAKSMFLQTWNLNAFQSVVNYLWDNGNCYKLERGEKI